MVADDLGPISEILLREHEESADVIRLRNKIENAKVELEGLSSKLKKKGKGKNRIEKRIAKLQREIEEMEKQLEQEEKELNEIREEINKLQDKYRSHPDFDKYEAYRDKGINLSKLTEEEMRILRKDLQIIFQDPYSSLNPRMTVGQIISRAC